MSKMVAGTTERSSPWIVYVGTANYRSNICDSRIRELRISELYFVIFSKHSQRTIIFLVETEYLVYELVI